MLDNQDFLTDIKEEVMVQQVNEELTRFNTGSTDKENKQLNNMLKQ